MIKYKYDEVVISISDRALAALSNNTQVSDKPETGGLIFGRRSETRIIVEECVVIKVVKKQSRAAFWPCNKEELRVIRMLKKSGLNYLGDWHTHPQEIPTPSFEDICSMKKSFKESIHRLPFFLLIVVGWADFPSGLSVNIVNESAIKELELYDK